MSLQSWNIWFISLLPIFSYVFAFIFRCYYFWWVTGYWETVKQNALQLQRFDNLWAERYMAVIGSCVLFPDKITAPFLINHSKNLEAQWGLIRRINYLPEKPNLVDLAILTLLDSIEQTIIDLPSEDEIHITLVIDVPSEQRDEVCSSLIDGWSSTFPDKPVPKSIDITDRLSSDWIETQLSQGSIAYELLLVVQLQGKNDYSDGLAVFLLATDDTDEKYPLNSIARVLRPRPLDTAELASDLASFLRIQTLSHQTKNIIADSQKAIAMLPDIFLSGQKYGIAWRANDVLLLEMFMGTTGPFSEWLLMAFAIDVASLHSTPSLALSITGKWVTTVVPVKAA